MNPGEIMLKDKNGQLGQTIYGLFALIAIIVIVGLYVILTISISNIKNNHEQNEIYNSFDFSNDEFMFKSLNLTIEDNNESLLASDIIIKRERLEINDKQTYEALRQIVDEKNNCLLVISQSKENKKTKAFVNLFVKYEDNTDYWADKALLEIEKYNNKLKQFSVKSLDGKIMTFNYYYGSCTLEENK